MTTTIVQSETSGFITMANIAPSRVENTTASAYRLRRGPAVGSVIGELVLQGAFQWTEGFNNGGSEWRDIHTVEE